MNFWTKAENKIPCNHVLGHSFMSLGQNVVNVVNEKSEYIINALR